MRLIVLGSGTCVPSLSRNAPGYLLVADDFQVLVDCGEGTMKQLLLAGFPFEDIDAVFLSHYHPDHVSGLLPLLHALNSSPGLLRRKGLQVVGPSGLEAFFQNSIWSCLARPEKFQVMLTEIDSTLQAGPFRVTAARTSHTQNSLAYRFAWAGKTVVFSGDCDYDEGLVNLAHAADLLVIECSFPNSMKAAGHLIPRECGLIGERARVKKMVLTHMYPSPFPDDVRVQECHEVYTGRVLLAEDLMEVTV